jgi:hypothetical protein
LSGRKVAAKTGTSTYQYKKNWEDIKLPRNLWTAWYTPQYTTVVWSWNTDGKPLNDKWNGLEWSGPIWKQFMEYLHQKEPVENWQQPSGVKQTSISSISWFLPGKSTSSSFIISSLFINPPNKYDNSFKSVRYDALCKWQVTDKTPEWAIKTWVFIALNSLKPTLPAWEVPVQSWAKSWWLAIIAGQNSWNIITWGIWWPCAEREQYDSSDIRLGTNLKNWSSVGVWDNSIEIAFKNTNPIREIEFYVNDVLTQTIDTTWRVKWLVRPSFYVANTAKNVQLRIRAIDSLYYAAEKSITLNVAKDESAPEIILKNPSDASIKLYTWDSFNLRAQINEISILRTVNIYMDGKILSSWLNDKSVVFTVSSAGLELGNHTLVIEAIDQSFNKWTSSVNVEVIEGSNPDTPSEDTSWILDTFFWSEDEDTLPEESSDEDSDISTDNEDDLIEEETPSEDESVVPSNES